MPCPLLGILDDLREAVVKVAAFSRVELRVGGRRQEWMGKPDALAVQLDHACVGSGENVFPNSNRPSGQSPHGRNRRLRERGGPLHNVLHVSRQAIQPLTEEVTQALRDRQWLPIRR